MFLTFMLHSYHEMVVNLPFSDMYVRKILHMYFDFKYTSLHNLNKHNTEGRWSFVVSFCINQRNNIVFL